MHPDEFWWLADMHLKDHKKQKMYGKLTQEEVEELYEENYGHKE